MKNSITIQILCHLTYARPTSLILFRQFCTVRRARPSKEGFSKVLTGKLLSVKKQFDDVLGIAEVRAAQGVVQEAEDEFMKSRRSVQETRTELSQLQSQLRELRSKLDRIPREDERYLQLATEEHKVLVEERKLKTDLEGFVALERDNFAALSAAVRNAHERERSRAERTKYWSIIGSACGAVLGKLIIIHLPVCLYVSTSTCIHVSACVCMSVSFLYVCLYIYLSVCLCMYLSVCLYMYLSVSMSACLISTCTSYCLF